ncbi:hypothetical protein CRG98_025025 [Punica granatum]|uniref:Major facilitator superfamily (MFS) profile domain-containing protein n=1 Tax=Punica granatum TaxID=22663 RepID=A0A2I0JE31_PUNGR|nr:hypothetical protein CRG98_025025 [Punica granatum]
MAFFSDQYRLDRKKPSGSRLLEYMKKAPVSFKAHQAIVLNATFFAYASFHAARKTTSVDQKRVMAGSGWAPFNGSDGSSLLGELDLAFLTAYAFGMYFSGHFADRMSLRIILAAGMIGSGLFASLFGVAYWANIHNFYYFLAVQMLAGLFQSTGWPSAVAVVGNWFGKRKRKTRIYLNG